MNLGLWFMFPVATGIAAVAMLTGIGGAVMFAPFFMLVLGLDPLLAMGAGLAIEFFGFSSGLLGYLRKKKIDFRIATKLIPFTLPGTVAGVFLGRVVPASVLPIMLSLLLLYLSSHFLLRGSSSRYSGARTGGAETTGAVTWTTKITNLLGGLSLGMISAGLGEVNQLNFRKKMRLSVATASATSVFLVAISAYAGSALHAYFLFSERTLSVIRDVASILVFSVPGVLLGAQVGVFLVNIMNQRVMGKFVGVLFLALAILTPFRVIG